MTEPRTPPTLHSTARADAPVTRTGFPFEALPGDVFDGITACLLGDELVRLSHVNRRLFTELLADPELWNARLGQTQYTDDVPKTGRDAKRQYLHRRSLRFPGRRTATQDPNARGACVPVPTFFRREDRFQPSPRHRVQLSNHPFSMDMWFSVSPSEQGTFDGGILIGSQSIPCQATDRWAENYNHFVYMDTKRTLYCSVLGRDEEIAEQLQCGRWYHLTLTFDGGEQSVYLDGELRRRTHGSLQHEWRYLHYTQLGTGYMNGASVAKPTPEFTGWYAFHGLIDEFRLWKRALDVHEVEMLTLGLRLKVQPVYKLKTDEDLPVWGPVERVPCSRPLETRCEVRRVNKSD